ETDSTPIEEPKDASTCNVYSIYELMASEEQKQEMLANYARGGYGYGHAKQALYELILEKFSEARVKYEYYMQNPEELDAVLAEGAAKARVIAENTIQRVRSKVGY